MKIDQKMNLTKEHKVINRYISSTIFTLSINILQEIFITPSTNRFYQKREKKDHYPPQKNPTI